jgi:serine/threonine-protein kinase
MVDSEAHDGRLVADAKIGNYRITRVIGEGGMGVVYEGVHESLGKRVAIKTLLAIRSNNDELNERFVREGRAIAKIRHPNVVDVFDVAVHDGSPYLVMEYLEGEDLGARMEHEAPMTAPAIADMLIPIVSALAAAHDVGIVHRDLKPENIFVTRTKGGSPEPKLVDFGISKLRDTDAMHLTSTHAMLGTPYYMSPEQAGSAKSVDHRSDIFSLGVILYQCATHELPFRGDSLYELLGAIINVEPPSPRSLVGQLPPSFEALIARAMKKDPRERFQSAAELGSALLPFASTRTRLSYEGEFGGESPVSTPAVAVARSEGGPRWLWASPVLLVAVVIGAWMLFRGGGAKDDHAAPSAETTSGAALAPPASALTPAASPAAVTTTRAPTAEVPSGAPAPKAEAEDDQSPSAAQNLGPARAKSGGAKANREAAKHPQPARPIAPPGAAQPVPVAPEPHAAPVAAPPSDSLFLDRK